MWAISSILPITFYEFTAILIAFISWVNAFADLWFCKLTCHSLCQSVGRVRSPNRLSPSPTSHVLKYVWFFYLDVPRYSTFTRPQPASPCSSPKSECFASLKWSIFTFSRKTSESVIAASVQLITKLIAQYPGESLNLVLHKPVQRPRLQLQRCLHPILDHLFLLSQPKQPWKRSRLLRTCGIPKIPRKSLLRIRYVLCLSSCTWIIVYRYLCAALFVGRYHLA